jgi:hypothetical protein
MEILIVLGSGAFVLGLAFVVWIAVTKQRGQGTANWPHVKGQIVEAEIVSLERETPSATQRTFTRVVAYSYEVAGQSYRARNVDFLPDTSATYRSRDEAQASVSGYEAGSTVNVFHNPANPKQSALEVPKPTAHNAVLFYGVVNMVAGAIIIAIGILLLP